MNKSSTDLFTTKSLEIPVKEPPDENKLTWQNMNEKSEIDHLNPTDKLEPFPSSLYDAFGRLANFVRDLTFDTPEIVLIGYSGEGKTSLLESLVGYPIINSPNLRPIYFQMINNSVCETPLVTIARDKVLAKFSQDHQLNVQELPEAMEARNISSNEPIIVSYQHKFCLDMTFIDTPGFSADKKEREQLVLDLASKQDRILLFVEEADATWENTKLLKILEQLDPKFSRSIFVYSKFHGVLSSFASSHDLETFFSSRPPTKVQSFFVTLLSKSLKQTVSSNNFLSFIEKAGKRDQILLEKLKYESRRKDEKHFGLVPLRKHIYEVVSKKYSDNIPIFLKQIRQKKKEATDNLIAVQEQLRTLDKSKLRSIAANYVTNFSQLTKETLLGSMEGGNPFTCGHDLAEELNILGNWWNEFGEPIKLPDPKISKSDIKLYGGQQFQRLLNQFKYIVEQTSVGDLMEDDILNAISVSGRKNVNSLIWAVSDLVQRRCNEVFPSLVKQLSFRGIYIAKRVPDIISGILEAKNKLAFARKETQKQELKISEYPQFVWYVKDLYEEFVDITAENCFQKCLNELQCTQMIYWQQKTNLNPPKSAELSDKLMISKKDWKTIRPQVEKLSQEIYSEQQERILKNILLKTHEFFLIKMAENLSSALQGISVNLGDEELAKMFNLKSTLEKLAKKEEELKKVCEKEDESPFMESASVWSSRLRLDLK